MKKLFTSYRIGNLELSNRVIKAATHENLAYSGNLSEDLIDYHINYAENGDLGLITTGYVSVHQNGVSWDHQMYFNRTDEQKEELTGFVNRIHEINNQPISIQLGHCGVLSKKEFGGVSMGPSRTFNKETLRFSKKMTKEDIDDVIEQYIFAAETSYQCGFDAVELHFAHGYLVSEFLSSAINRRKDEYGCQSLENRARIGVEIISGVREAINDDDFPIFVKYNSTDCVKNGTTLEESIEFAKMFENAGANALIASQGLGHLCGRDPIKACQGQFPLDEIVEAEESRITRFFWFFIKRFINTDTKFERLFLLNESSEIAKHVDIPVIYVGGVSSLEDIEILLDGGFDLIQIGRPLIRDPGLMRKIKKGEIKKKFGCSHCNKCFITIWKNDGLDCHWNTMVK